MPLPPTLANKKAIINVKNKDNKCFLWAVLAAIHPASKDAQRVAKYKRWELEFDDALKDIEFPVQLSDVFKFAKRTNISINVYTFDTKRVVPLIITKEEKETHVDLLYLSEKDNNQYRLIQNLSRLLRSQLTKDEKKVYFCRMCLNKFDSKISLDYHKTYCGAHKPVRIEMPEPYNNTLEFENYNQSVKVPFVIYADFECMLLKTSYTNTYQKHVPNNFVYHVKYSNENYKAPVEYSGEDAPKVFYQKLK